MGRAPMKDDTMFTIHKQEVMWGGRKLTLETGRIARQADGAVLATYGDTVVLCAVTAAKSVKEGQDFFPLTVHYQEKFSAAGRIPGGFFKRERGATEHETLTSRLIDRPIRPLFPEGFYNEVLIIAQVLSYDGENEADIVALVAASAALTLSGVPFMGPLAAARVAYVDGQYVLNPTKTQIKEGSLELIAAGTRDAILMVESEAKELSEEVMLGAVMFAHNESKPVIEAIIKLAEAGAKDPWELKAAGDAASMIDQIKGVAGAAISDAYKIIAKADRQSALGVAKSKVKDLFAGSAPAEALKASKLVKKIEAGIVRSQILKDGIRIDGRDTKTVRPIEAMVGFLPRTHGSALFTRGETQAIVSTTLGTSDSEQMIDGLDGLRYERFMLHYNFLPYPRPVRHHRVERLVVDGDGLRRVARAYGCGRPARPPGCRHRDGADPRRQGLRRPQRHPRRRGPPRRHGLQGCRYVRGRHRAADGHQGRRNHRADHEGRAQPGEGRA
jgi:polyribonucleotide nucleotidyltransferase